MRPRQLPHRLLCLLSALLFVAATAASARADEDEEDYGRDFAVLSVRVGANGSAVVIMTWGSGQPLTPALQQKLNETFGVELQKFVPQGMEEYEAYLDGEGGEEGQWHSFYGRADNAFARGGLLVSGRLNLAPLAEEFRSQGVTRLSVTMVLPQSAGFSDVTGAQPCDPQLKYYVCSRLDLAAGAPAPIAFSFGYRFADVLRKWAPLGIFLLALPALTLLMRRRALRAGERDPAASWFSYFRFLNLAVTATWLLWLPLYAWANPDEIFHFLSDTGVADFYGEYTRSRPAAPLGFEVLKLAFYFVPPVLSTILCHLLSHKVFTRVRGLDWSPSEVARQALWSQAAFLLPIFFMLLGMTSIRRTPSLAAVCFLLAFVAWQVCARLSSKAQRWTPRALTTGPLRDRIFELAARAGVPLKQIYLLPAGKGQMANAFARSDGAILLTDSLPRHLSEREVVGIVAHELAHLKERHPRTLTVIFITTVVVADLVAGAFGGAASLDRWMPALTALSLGAAMLVTHYVSRGYERHADALAITLTRDPEAFITALAKLARLNLMPIHWGSWGDAWSTHPSTEGRIRRLAEYGGVPPERLRELVEAAQTEPLRDEPLPTETVENEKVFSTVFKARQAQRITWTIIAVVVGVPVLLAALLQRSQPAGAAKWLALFGGLLLTFLIYQVVRNFAGLSGYKSLREGLGAKLRGAGFAPEEGTFVGFAPAAAPRIYEGNYIWDAGYLFLTDEQFCYAGEETRFALKREQVAAVYLGDGPADWVKRPTVYVRWRDEERNAGGTFYLFPGEARSLWASRRKSSEMYSRIGTWLGRGSAHAGAAGPLAQLSSPAYGSVTSLTPAEVFTAAKTVNSLVMLSIFSLILAVAFRLDLAAAAYAVAVTITLSLLDHVPRLLGRKKKHAAEEAPEPTPYQQGAWAETET